MLANRDAAAEPTTALFEATARSRTHTLLLLGAAVICGAALGYVIGRLVMGRPVADTVLGWTVLSAASTWVALMCRKGPWCAPATVLAAAVLIHAGLSLASTSLHSLPGPHIGTVLLWAALLLPPALVLLLGAYAPLAVISAGFSVTLAPPSPGSESLWIVELGAFLVVPVAASAILAARARETQTEVGDMVQTMEERRAHLEEDLARKARELELSLERLSEAQKLESLRTIAAGLAHELNNTLTPIRGLAEMLASGQQPDNAERYGRRILHSASSAASIAEALMTYTRQGTFSPVRTDLRALLDEEVLPAIARRLPSRVHIDTDLAESVHVSVDRALIRQCLEHLVNNSVDAMPGGGTIRVELRATRPSGAGMARLAVADQGVGIPIDAQDRVFDPFYTTKAAGTARGLGLPMVEGTVTRHGGRVHLESEPDRGTKVIIELPLAEPDSASSPATRGTDHQREPVVVVLSGDQDVLDVLEELLCELHCAPVCTTAFEVARAAVRRGEHPAVLLVVDDALRPGVDELVRMARQPGHEIPVILTVSHPSAPGVRPLDEDPQVVRSPLDTHLLSPLITSLLEVDGPSPARVS